MSQIEGLEARAGFWRRYVAFLIDVFIVQLLAAILVGIPVGVLFAASNGAIQFGPTERTLGGVSIFEAGWELKFAGINLIHCANVDLAQLPEGLDPAPPAQATFAVDCRNFAFGFLETARGLTVGRISKEGTTTSTSARSYALGADGKPRKAVSLDWLPPLLFFIYLVALQCRFGATWVCGHCILGSWISKRPAGAAFRYVRRLSAIFCCGLALSRFMKIGKRCSATVFSLGCSQRICS
jgi:hypothetical protein